MAKKYFESKTDKKKPKAEKKPRRNPFRFFKEMGLELKKVTWPSRKDLITFSVAVLVFIGLFAVIVFGMDTGLSQLLKLAVGK